MTDARKRKLVNRLFTTIGIVLLPLTIFRLMLGRDFEMLYFMMSGPFGVGIIFVLCALAVVAATLAFQQKRDGVREGDKLRQALAVIILPWTIFAAGYVSSLFNS